MTFFTTNKNLPVPDDGQDDWDDEIQQCFTQIDTYLKGIDETSLTKVQADLESLSIGSSVNIKDGGKIVIGTDGDLSIQYNPATNTSTVIDEQSGESMWTYPHGTSAGPITTERDITMKSGPVASQSYSDATAIQATQGDISPTSITTNAVLSDSVNSDVYNGVRMFSSFNTLQDAVTYSDTNNATIFIDGQFTIDETGIEIPETLNLVGLWKWSQITVDASTIGPLFTVSAGTGLHETHIEGIEWHNADTSSCEAWFECEYGGSFAPGWFSRQSLFRDLLMKGFGGTYVMHVRNAYAVTFENILIRNHSTGGFKFHQCNASCFINIDVTTGGDGETPAMYFFETNNAEVVSPYFENITTDAAMQIAEHSNIRIYGIYLEQHNGALDCAIQVGDAGKTAGNTEGTSGGSSFHIFGGFLQGGGGGSAMRLVNVTTTHVMGVNMGSWDYGISVGTAGGNFGKNYANPQCEGRAESLQFFNIANQQIAPGFNDDATLLYYNDHIYTSRPVADDLQSSEIAFGDAGEIYYKESSSGKPVHYWVADGTF